MEVDPNGDCIRDTSIENLSCPDSPDPNNIFGDPLLNPRVGNEYQVNIPSMITESKRLELFANPLDCKSLDVSHSFLVGLPIPITWFYDEENDNEGGGSGSPRNSDNMVDANRSVEARIGKKDRSSSRKKSSELNVKENSEPMRAETNLNQFNGSKSYYPVPGLSTNPWSDAEDYKSFADGRISLEEYVSSLKSSVSIPILAEAVAIGTGKEDLTGFAMEPGKGNHDTLGCPHLPTGQDCSSLTSEDIVNLLTGGFRLSKARCNDIFWEAVWPRLLAKGWHSEQPRDQTYISSKSYLVFLVPGIKKFSRRKLAKGEHYFDSVSDVLNKVASEPKLLELETEESSVGGRNEQGSWSPEVGSDQDDPSDSRRHWYLRPLVSTSSSSNVKFTVVDTSLFCGGKSSSIRELRHLPAEFKLISKQNNHSIEDERDSSDDNVDEFKTVGKPFHSEKAKNRNSISDKAGPNCTKFTVVDTSVVREGKPSKVRELRCSPVVVKRASESTLLSRKTDKFDLSGGHEKNAADIPSKGKRKISKSNSHKDIRESACKNQMATKKDSDAADKMETKQDQNTCVSDEKHLKKTVLHQFKRRAKSGNSDYVVPVVKRRRLTACAKGKTSEPSHNCSQGLELKQMELQGEINSPKMNKNFINEVGPREIESSSVFPAESGAEEDMHLSIMRQDSAATCTSEGRKEKHQTEASIDLNNEMPIEKVQGSQRENTHGQCSSSKEKELVSETLKTSTANPSEQNPTVNRRQSTRNRPLTARALEALANGFLNVQRRSKSADVLGGENLFSSPFRKARSKAKVAPSSHGNTVTGVMASREDKKSERSL